MKISIKTKDGQKIKYSDPSVDNPHSDYIIKLIKGMKNAIQVSPKQQDHE